MTERGRAHAVRSAMTKTPRTPPSSTGVPRPPGDAPRSGISKQAPAEAPAESNPFASLASSAFGEPDGETKAFEVPRELIELARARAAEPTSTKGTLTPIAPRPNAELEATLAAYTAGLAPGSSGRAPSFQPEHGERPPRQEVETLRSQPVGTHEESGTVLRAQRATEDRGATPDRGSTGHRPSASERKPLLRSPVSAHSRPAPRSSIEPLRAGPPRGLPWPFYVGLFLVAGYCAYLLLNS